MPPASGSADSLQQRMGPFSTDPMRLPVTRDQLPMQEQEEAKIPILIVDDEPDVIEAYRSILEEEEQKGTSELDALSARLFPDAPRAKTDHGPGRPKFLLETASSAEEAVARVRQAMADGRTFSIIFLDMRMRPGPDGLWAAERIREMDRLVEIIICTAYSDVNPLDIADRVFPPEKLFYIQKPFHLHEVRQMASALGRKRLAEDQVARLAYFDALTGLPNRAQMLRLTKDAMEQADAASRGFAVLYFDLVNFKRVNDALGHGVGDRVLQEIARRLSRVSELLRQQPPAAEAGSPSVILSRLGSDEFLMLLPLDNPVGQHAPEVEDLAVRMQQEISQPIVLDVCEVQVSLSIGVAIYPQDGTDPEKLFNHADLAMRFAKRQGQGRVQSYAHSMNEDFLRRLTLEGLLRGATERQELSLFYEPQVDLQTGRCIGMEALLRWHCAEVGIVSPAEFIPVAEESGLIIPIGEWVLREACRQVLAWRGEGLVLERICVNISPVQMCQPGFSDLIERVMEESGLPAGCLELEITESSLLNNPDACQSLLGHLKGRGLKFAIDDFGTGYSSLHRLKEFDVDRLKIDRSFIMNITSQDSDVGIVSAIISMGRSLGLEVIAEGIEQEEQAAILRNLGCEQIQGYLISRPMPADQARSFIGERVLILPGETPSPMVADLREGIS